MAEELLIQKSLWTRLKDYTADVRMEMKRVTWPGKQEVYSTTVLVVLTTFFFAALFWIYDQLFLRLIGRILLWGSSLH